MLAAEEAEIQRSTSGWRPRPTGCTAASPPAASATWAGCATCRICAGSGAADPTARHGQAARRLAGAERAAGDRSRGHRQELRCQGAVLAALLDPNPARRPGRGPGAERRRQDHAAGLLTGEIEPDGGTVRLGTGLEIARFDQHRAQLDPEQTPWEILCPHGGDRVQVRGALATWSAICATSCSATSRPASRSRRCPAASATGCCSPRSWPSPRTS